MSKAQFLFGDIVVVDEGQIGVICKTWERLTGKQTGFYYDVYVRSHNTISEYDETQIERYRVRHKYLDEAELMYQND